MSKGNLYVAHYGHPLLKGAKHWSFLLFKSPEEVSSDGHDATAYQITGSTNTYQVKPPEEVYSSLSRSYLGKVCVGNVTISQRLAFEEVVLNIPVVTGNLGWNCQNWVIAALAELKQKEYDVRDFTHDELFDKLASSTK